MLKYKHSIALFQILGDNTKFYVIAWLVLLGKLRGRNSLPKIQSQVPTCILNKIPMMCSVRNVLHSRV